MRELTFYNYVVMFGSGGAAFALSYWLLFPQGLHLSPRYVSVLAALAVAGIAHWVETHPKRIILPAEYDEEAKYWRIRRPDGEDYDICFATRRSQHKIPEPERQGNWELVGKIHCVVKDRFWVWPEGYDRDGMSRPVVDMSHHESRGY